MFASNQRSAETIAAYERETSRLVAQCQRENPNDAPRSPLVQAARWFLNGHARWAGNTIRLYANALEQEVGRMLEYDTFDPGSEEALLLRRLKNDRPTPIAKIKVSKKSKQVAHQQKVVAKKKKKQKPRKSIPVSEVRELVRYFAPGTMNSQIGSPGILFLPLASVGDPAKCLFCSAKGIFFAPPPKSIPTAAA